ncbi:hypothetical protein KI387_031807, partial [Taxus chinensis]
SISIFQMSTNSVQRSLKYRLPSHGHACGRTCLERRLTAMEDQIPRPSKENWYSIKE